MADTTRIDLEVGLKDSATPGLKNLEGTLQNVGSVATASNTALGETSTKMTQLQSATNSAASAMENFKAKYASAWGSASQGVRGTNNVETAMQNIKSQFANAWKEASAGVVPTASPMQSVPQVEQAAAEAMQENAMAASQATQAYNQLQKAEEGVASANRSVASSAKSAQSATEGASAAAKESKGAAERASSGFHNLAKSFMRIAKLRLLRGIIRSITQGVKEGMQNLYQYSAALNSADGSHFAATMDRVATTILQVKNTLGSVVAPIMNFLGPVIQWVADKFISAANGVAQFIAALSGQSTYTRAKRSATTWQTIADNAGGAADAIGGAADAAEAYKNTILGFDEINALNDPTGGGSGGGSGGGNGAGGISAPDYSEMFEEVPIQKTGLLGLLNKIAGLIGPIIKDILDIITQFTDGLEKAVDATIDFISAWVEGDFPAMHQAVKDLQDMFSSNDVWNWLAHAYYEFDAWLKQVWNDFKMGMLISFRDLVDWVSPALKVLYGFDASPVVDQLNESIDKLMEESEAIETTKQLWLDFYDGNYDEGTILLAQQYVADGITNYDEALKKAKDTMRQCESGFANVASKIQEIGNQSGISKEQLLQLAKTNPNFYAILEATGDVDQALQDIVDGAWSAEDGVIKLGDTELSAVLWKSLLNISDGAVGVKDDIGKAKDEVSKFDRQKPSFSGIRNSLRDVATKVSDVAKGVRDSQERVEGFNRLQPNFNGVTSGFSNITTASDNTKKSVGFTKGSIDTLNNMSPGFWGIRNGFANSTDSAWRFQSAIQAVKDTIDKINNVFITIGAKFVEGKKDGGFVNHYYAEGGYVDIPRFDGSGIHSANLFMTHENGIPEMVGRIGNRTAVANTSQMVEALEDGVFRGVMAAQGGQSSNTEVTVYMDSEAVARAADRGNKSRNRRFNVSLA